MSGALTKAYRMLLATATLVPDRAQADAVGQLQRLAGRLEQRGRYWRRLLRRSDNAPRGIYLHGGVGRGKTMLMDLFFAHARHGPKRRLHFHELMGEVHEAIADARRSGTGDPIPTAAEVIARDARLLCLDELIISDIADVHILGRLLTALLDQGVVIVTTSNAAPRDLYPNGLNRDRLLPFIAALETRLDIVGLDAQRDYRLEKLAGTELYVTPADATARARLDAAFRRLTGAERGEHSILRLKGRTLDVPEARLGVARFAFTDLCARPLGAADYLAIARGFHTVMIDRIPVMGPEQRNEARRFTTLIDTLYDHHVRLLVSADAAPANLYRAADGSAAFARTVSRLVEMQSQAYVEGRSSAGAGEAIGIPAP